MSLCRMHNITKTYFLESQTVEVLRGISLDIDEGEFVAVVGPSGSGKSTLMHLLGCLDVPTSGQYALAGEEVSNLTDDQLSLIRNRHIGFVFQSYQLLPRLSAIENVETPLIYQRVPQRERREKAGKALEEVGLKGRAEHLPSELSGGESQRVAIARALVGNPKLLLADEPTGNLDRATGKDIMEIFRTLNRDRGLTAIVVTHDSEVAALCSRKVRIRDGRIE